MAVSRAEEFMTAFSQIFYRISVLVYNVFSWGYLWFSFTLGSDIFKSSVSCHYSLLLKQVDLISGRMYKINWITLKRANGKDVNLSVNSYNLSTASFCDSLASHVMRENSKCSLHTEHRSIYYVLLTGMYITCTPLFQRATFSFWC